MRLLVEIVKKLAPAALVVAAIGANVSAAPANLNSGIGNKNGKQAVGAMLYYLPDLQPGSAPSTYAAVNEPPLLHSSKVSPEEPKPLEQITFTAEIYNNPDVTDAKVIEAFLYYSVNNRRTWRQIPMEHNESQEKVWTAKIPKVKGECTINYYYVATDDAGNSYVEVPNQNIIWGGALDGGYDISFTDKKVSDKLASDDLNITQHAIGYDGKYLYFEISVGGEISSGTITPLAMNLYSVGVFLPSRLGDLTPGPDFVLEHTQHAQFANMPIVGLIDTAKGLTNLESADARYYSKRNHLYMRVDTRFLKDAENNDPYIRLVFGTALVSNVAPIVINAKDVTPFINLVLGDRAIEVKK